MFDINFFEESNRIKKKIISRRGSFDGEKLYSIFERLRSRQPFIFNIETTNACNMQCIMCPRPKLMTRPVRHMDMGLFEKIVTQVAPHKKNRLRDFWSFVNKEYGLSRKDRDENAFYFFTVSKSLTLHGFGEPLLDPYITERVALCAELNIPTYFSCVPANINVEKITSMMKAGLGTIKFSLDALDDRRQRDIRGPKNDFTGSYKKIISLIEFKTKHPSVKTQIVLTMVALSRNKEDIKMYRDFLKLWLGKPVFAYIKSQDNRWFHEKDKALACKSHYAAQYCEFPWTSMTIMTDGSVVPCSQDYNCEMVLGDANAQPLQEIWNNSAYDELRRFHITGKSLRDYKCASRCDIKALYKRL